VKNNFSFISSPQFALAIYTLLRGHLSLLVLHINNNTLASRLQFLGCNHIKDSQWLIGLV